MSREQHYCGSEWCQESRIVGANGVKRAKSWERMVSREQHRGSERCQESNVVGAKGVKRVLPHITKHNLASNLRVVSLVPKAIRHSY